MDRQPGTPRSAADSGTDLQELVVERNVFEAHVKVVFLARSGLSSAAERMMVAELDEHLAIMFSARGLSVLEVLQHEVTIEQVDS